jgi:hypothetical protein
LHAENIFVGFVVPENKIFYAALKGRNENGTIFSSFPIKGLSFTLALFNLSLFAFIQIA